MSTYTAPRPNILALHSDSGTLEVNVQTWEISRPRTDALSDRALSKMGTITAADIMKVLGQQRTDGKPCGNSNISNSETCHIGKTQAINGETAGKDGRTALKSAAKAMAAEAAERLKGEPALADNAEVLSDIASESPDQLRAVQDASGTTQAIASVSEGRDNLYVELLAMLPSTEELEALLPTRPLTYSPS